MRPAWFFALPLLLVSAFSQISYTLLPRTTIENRLAEAKKENPDREATLVELFKTAGCDGHISLLQVKGSKLHNVVCELPGSSATRLVVAAHFDKVHEGMGVVDNWSGASLLPSLYESLKTQPRTHTILFIGFADEEKGMVGSHFYVQHLTALDPIDAMVNMDTLGLGTTEIWVSGAEPTLVRWALAVGKAKNIEVRGMNVDQIGSSDSQSFFDKRIPAITFHSLTQDTLTLLHSDRDVAAAVKLDDYYQSYQFLAAYLAIIDVKIDSSVRAAFQKKK